jgi:hypothetical protein
MQHMDLRGAKFDFYLVLGVGFFGISCFLVRVSLVLSCLSFAQFVESLSWRRVGFGKFRRLLVICC